MPGIGVLSTIPWAPFAASFDQGLNLPAVVYRNLQDGLGYGGLANGLNHLVADGSVTLIVAAGGLVTELAATNSTKDYIGLVGAPPAASGRYSKGRVDLHSVANDHMHRTHLQTAHNIPFNAQCLFSNSMSAMSGQERGPAGAGAGTPWGYIANIQISEADTPAQRQQKYANAFTAIPANIRATIISADPFFNRYSSELVQAANTWVNAAGTSRRVCYPLQEYLNTAPNPAAGKTCICGPFIQQAYNYLGQLAAHVIQPVGHPAPGNLPQPACSDH